MKWLFGACGVAVVAGVVWASFFSFDFKANKARIIENQAVADEVFVDADTKAGSSPSSSSQKVGSQAEDSIVAGSDTVVSGIDAPETTAKDSERMKGSKDAPIKIYEFSSFSCYHCAIFHSKALPKLEKYIQNGDVAIYFKDIFLDRRSAAATLLSRCIPSDKYWDFLDVLFSTQARWGVAPDYKNTLINYASMQGLDKDTASSCMEDKELLKKLVNKRDAYVKKYSIVGTPTVIVTANGVSESVSNAGEGRYVVAKIESILNESKGKIYSKDDKNTDDNSTKEKDK